VAGAVYGLPAVESPIPTAVAVLLGAVAFTSLGLLLGTVVPTARAAQGIGLLLFFPSFLLGGGGPPTKAMSATMRSIAKVLPLTHVTDSIRQPWLGLGGATGDLIVVAGVLVVWRGGARRAWHD
jgi:ABC-2 type transport system permease protein